MTASPTSSKIVNGLIAAISDHHMQFTVLPADDFLDAHSLAEVQLVMGGASFRCLCDNEYDDVRDDNHPLLLNMVLMELETYDQSEDFLVWSNGHGLPAGDPRTSQLWDRLADNARQIPPQLGPGVKPISSWDWSLDAGDAQILRNLPPALGRPLTD